ncbi:MAG TPA: class I SAM-dependent methyltransferase [Acidimicrobiales bacterium]|nr:class I SAM-dependent methyltransferase [Acidimicrobiales bacterium]
MDTAPTDTGPIDTGRIEEVTRLARSTRGFMPDDEGAALLAAARQAGEAFAGRDDAGRDGAGATFVEIGAWCGKSTLYLGAAAEATGAVLFSVDHHRGSEENQAGWEHHDADLVDPVDGRLDTLPHWRRAVAGAGLESTVVGLVGDSPTIAGRWRTPLAFCFIDGGHGAEPAWADYRGWAPQVAVDGWLAIHDVFPDPADGGRPPYELWCHAVASGEWVEDGECGSLRVLRRLPDPPPR